MLSCSLLSALFGVRNMKLLALPKSKMRAQLAAATSLTHTERVSESVQPEMGLLKLTYCAAPESVTAAPKRPEDHPAPPTKVAFTARVEVSALVVPVASSNGMRE